MRYSVVKIIKITLLIIDNMIVEIIKIILLIILFKLSKLLEDYIS
jgi:hypothetical protein